MTPAQAAELERLFHAARTLPHGGRRQFLLEQTAGDAELMSRVERLLEINDDPEFEDFTGRVGAATRHLLERPDQMIGQSVGPYAITALIGAGGMGVVYRAVRADVDATVALKIVTGRITAAAAARFERERRTLARLRHPGIAMLFDAGTTEDGIPWFAMELVDGVPLMAHCDRTRAGLRERIGLFRQICEAVHFAHQQLVVHRDLKPSNVLVTPTGTVKLIDFGVAAPVADGGAGEPLALTPAYAAPEQLAGGEATVQGDLYSLGVLCHQLMTGTAPRPASAEGVPSGAPRQMNEGGIDRRDLERICRQLLRADPADRPRSVDGLIRNLDRLTSDRPLEGVPVGVVDRARKFLRRRSQLVVSVSVLAAAAVALTVSYTRGLTRARLSAEAEADRARRMQRTLVGLLQGDDDLVGPADSVRVVTLLDRGVELAATLSNDPALQAELFETLGTLFMQVGRLPRADSLLTRSLALRSTLAGIDDDAVAAGLLALGRLRGEQARYAEAESTVRRAIALLGTSTRSASRRVADGHEVLAEVLELDGRYRAAIGALDTALARTDARADTLDELAPRWYSLANNYYYAGVHDTAELLTRRVLAVWQRRLGPTHPRVADAIINLGAIAQDRGELVRAESLYADGVRIIERWYGPEHPRTAGAVSMQGRAALLQQRTARADSLLRRALAIRQRALGADHPKVGLLLNELANIAFGRQDFMAAESLFLAAVGVYERAYRGPHQYIGTSQSGLASVYLARGSPARAEVLARAALGTFAVTLPADHVNAAVARLKLGRALLRQQRAVDGERELLAAYQSLLTKPGATSFVTAARKDLVTLYESQRRDADAARYRDPP